MYLELSDPGVAAEYATWAEDGSESVQAQAVLGRRPSQLEAPHDEDRGPEGHLQAVQGSRTPWRPQELFGQGPQSCWAVHRNRGGQEDERCKDREGGTEPECRALDAPRQPDSFPSMHRVPQRPPVRAVDERL